MAILARALRLCAANLALAALYAAVATLCMMAAVIQGDACPLWPPAGIALVAVITFGPRLAPGVAVGEFAAILIAHGHLPDATAMGIGNALGAVAGAALWRRAGARMTLDRLQDVLTLIAVCAAVPAMVTASVGTGSLLVTHGIGIGQLALTWRVWWLGDIAGVMVLAPLLLALLVSRRVSAPNAETVLSLTVLGVIALLVLRARGGQPYLLFPLLAWVGLRLGPARAAVANLLVAGIAVRLAATGHGPFAHDGVGESVLAAQTFLVVMAVTSLLLAAIASELRASQRAHAQLADAQQSLRRIAEAVARQDTPQRVRALADRERPRLPDPADREHVDRLVGVAVDAARVRADLVVQATTDPLTELANHGAFHERVAAELQRARRHVRDLSVAVFDLDGFKRVNDLHGHQAGDAVLHAAAKLLTEHARAGDVVARLGGDELAMLMPETDAAGAQVAVERVRAAIEAARLGPDRDVTVSAGVCDVVDADSAEDLLRHADHALYWVKARGGNQTIRFDATTMADADATAARRERTQALSGLRALARAIDARDPSTHRHSERVAELAVALARHRGWRAGAVARLRQAALVHDVGKLAVPDAVLFKPGALTPAERDEVRRHAVVGAEIVAEIMAPDQVAWIRGHHERHDGAGYPDALAGAAISEGAALLALADAWDAMTAARPYSAPLDEAAALAECEAQSGRQFAPYAVKSLLALRRAAVAA